MHGTISRPRADRGRPEAFTFGSADPGTQTMQNMMVMMTAPWAAFWALGTEMRRETFGEAKD